VAHPHGQDHERDAAEREADHWRGLVQPLRGAKVGLCLR
jgi:hypothetical protein